MDKKQVNDQVIIAFNQLETEAEIKRLEYEKNVVNEVKNYDEAVDHPKKPRKRRISKSRKKNIKAPEEWYQSMRDYHIHVFV